MSTGFGWLPHDRDFQGHASRKPAPTLYRLRREDLHRRPDESTIAHHISRQSRSLGVTPDLSANRGLARHRPISFVIVMEVFIRRLTAMGIRDRPISARSLWQNGLA